MSGSLASAKAKRAGINPPPSTISPRSQLPLPPPGGGGGVRLTVPQVLVMLESRITKLETGVRSAPVSKPTPPAPAQTDFQSTLDDMESKFMMLAEEISTMKDVIMKLQAFTMDVNKTMFEERIQIMSDIDSSIKTQVIEDPITIDKVSEVEVTAI